LALPGTQLSRRPALKSYIGKSVVLGVRSEDMEDASHAGAHSESRIKGKVTLTEALGSEIVVHLTFPGDAVVTADTELLAKETGEGELHLGDQGVKWVAS